MTDCQASSAAPQRNGVVGGSLVAASVRSGTRRRGTQGVLQGNRGHDPQNLGGFATM